MKDNLLLFTDVSMSRQNISCFHFSNNLVTLYAARVAVVQRVIE